MFTYEFLQQYWWFVIALLGGLLVFLSFVQGANAMIFLAGKNENERQMMVNSTGRKWELTFTTLVTFGGAFFASFPLFYSTSFGGAYWLWIVILISFVLQAVSYEFQSKPGNIIGKNAFRAFLTLNGIIGPFLIGVAVSTFFTGSDFLVNKGALTDTVSPIISVWGNNWHGLEALANPTNLMFGLAVTLLTTCLGILYLLNNIQDEALSTRLRKYLFPFTLMFAIFFVSSVIFILTGNGFAVNDGVVELEQFKYFYNLIQMPAVAACFLIGVILVLAGLFITIFNKRFNKGIWFAGIGTVFTVVALFLIAGYNGTAFYPSINNLQSSLTITNSSSSLFTLKTMTYVSFIIPFVVAYIAYAWHQMDKKKITGDEIENAETKY